MKTWNEIASNQPIATRILTNMIERNRLSHAYLIQGQKGTGKKAVSILLAKSFFCKNQIGSEPCHSCKDCVRIDSGNHPDVHHIAPEGASIKKEQIAHLQKEFTYTGLESNQKVYIITEADKMTTNAANRLLKFLEEPSKKTAAILTTENAHAILDTIRSRCQLIALRPLNTNQLELALIEKGLSKENARLFTVLTNDLQAALALDQDDWFAQARKLMVQLIEMLQTNIEEALLFIQKQWLLHFSDREQLKIGLDMLLYWYKDVMYLHIDENDQLVFLSYRENIEKSAMYWSKQDTTAILYAIMEARRHLEQNVHPTLVMEKLTLQMQR
ncbi:DNA polymerase-3 subunit delta' [Natronobacillus azotifigens]|uniref:DNA polymerase III subunit delta n=1 Tax=Natronobacillus azotifigens TaxID=472978 RepID=A0A9J6REM2_9BACI|nr:DNA polymerase III subunit delta' [Natronobacillus azotifigens]MCZ0703625.1 DNA polymerase III subunit delta' [Natronobacillus azotifigens]